MQKQIFLLLMLISSVFLNAQTTNSDIPFQNNYNREISIDLRGLLNSAFGNTLIYKKNLKPTEGQAENVFKRRRWQVEIGGVFRFADREMPRHNSSSFFINTIVSIGSEKFHQFRKFGLYYGIDYGLGLGLSTRNNRINDNINNSTSADKSISAVVTPFAGFSYRFSPRFSLSLESGLSFWCNYTRNYYAINDFRVRENNYGVGISSKNLRFLSMGYHF